MHLAAVMPQASLGITVNYARDLVEGQTDPEVPVTVIVEHYPGTGEEEAHLLSESDGLFSVGCADWSAGHCPDIVPGDSVCRDDQRSHRRRARRRHHRQARRGRKHGGRQAGGRVAPGPLYCVLHHLGLSGD